MLLSLEELEQSSKPAPEVKAFYEKNPPPELPSGALNPLALRAGLDAWFEASVKALGPCPSNQIELRQDIAMRDGHSNQLKITKPTGGRTPGPLVVLVFSGGFIAGSNDQNTGIARLLVKLFGATVVSISYRLAPEYRFPTAQHDAIDSMHWIAENATGHIIQADPTKGFLIGGTSAGAIITAPLTRKFQEDKLAYPLTGQFLGLPSIMRADTVPDGYKPYFMSKERNKDAIGSSDKVHKVVMEAVQWDDTHELRFATRSNTPISGQPRTYFQVAGMDFSRDDGLIYEEMLKEAGVPTKLDFYPGYPHSLHTLRDCEITSRVKTDELMGWAWLLGNSITREEAAQSLGLSG